MVIVEGRETLHGAVSKHDLDYADRWGESILPEVLALSPIGEATVYVHVWYEFGHHPFLACRVSIGIKSSISGREDAMFPYDDDLRDRLMQYLMAKNYPKP